jgi:hypothetical protein
MPRRTRSILIDNSLGKVFTNVDDSAVVNSSSVIASSVSKTLQFPPPTTTTKVAVLNNLGLSGLGTNFPNGAFITNIELSAVTAPKGKTAGQPGGDIAIRLRTGTSNSNSSNLGTFALPGPLTLKKYINQTLTISTGENLYVDIIRIGNSVTGAGFGFTISYFTS